MEPAQLVAVVVNAVALAAALQQAGRTLVGLSPLAVRRAFGPFWGVLASETARAVTGVAFFASGSARLYAGAPCTMGVGLVTLGWAWRLVAGMFLWASLRSEVFRELAMRRGSAFNAPRKARRFARTAAVLVLWLACVIPTLLRSAASDQGPARCDGGSALAMALVTALSKVVEAVLMRNVGSRMRNTLASINARGEGPSKGSTLQQQIPVARAMFGVSVMCWAPFVVLALLRHLDAAAASERAVQLAVLFACSEPLWTTVVIARSTLFRSVMNNLRRLRAASKAGRTAVASANADVADEYERLQLSAQDKQIAAVQIGRRLTLIVVELVDLAIDVFNFANFAADPVRLRTTYGYIFTVATVFLIGLSSALATTHWQQARSIRQEVVLGVEVRRGRSRQNAAGKDADLLEFEILRLQRKLATYRFLVAHALLGDLIMFVLAVFRLVFTEYVFSPALGHCLATSEASGGLDLFRACLSGGATTTFVQILFTSGAVVYKLSFLRDYSSAKRMLLARQAELLEIMRHQTSMLDQFAEGQVSSAEINSVISLRQAIATEVATVADQSIGSDLQLLHFLRASDLDAIEAAKAVRSWLEWRREHQVDRIRQRVLQEDIAWDDLPGMEELREAFLLVCQLDIDREQRVLVLYANARQSADLDAAISALGIPAARRLALHILEYLQHILDFLSEQDGRVFSMCVLWNAQSEPETTGAAGQVLSWFLDCFSLYPMRATIVLWKPSAAFAPLSERRFTQGQQDDSCARGHNLDVLTVRKPQQLFLHLDEKVIPRALDGLKSFSDPTPAPDLADPWGARGARSPALSQLCGRYSELDFYKDISRSEARKALEMKHFLQQEQAGALLMMKRSKLTQHGNFQRTATMMDMGNLGVQVQVKERIQELMSQFLTLGARLESLPPEAGGLLMLCRFLRAHDGDMFLASMAYLEVQLWRRNFKLDQLNDRIKQRDMAVSQLPMFDELFAACPMHPLLSYDEKSQSLLFLGLVTSQVDYKRLRELSAERLFESIAMLFEYLLIVVTALSESHRCNVTVRHISFVDSLVLSTKPFQDIYAAFSKLQDVHFPRLFHDSRIVVTDRSQTLANVALAGYSLLQTGQLQSYSAVTAYSATSDRGKRRLQRVIGKKALPRAFGGLLKFDVSALKTSSESFMPLDDLLKSLSHSDASNPYGTGRRAGKTGAAARHHHGGDSDGDGFAERERADAVVAQGTAPLATRHTPGAGHHHKHGQNIMRAFSRGTGMWLGTSSRSVTPVTRVGTEDSSSSPPLLASAGRAGSAGDASTDRNGPVVPRSGRPLGGVHNDQRGRLLPPLEGHAGSGAATGTQPDAKALF